MPADFHILTAGMDPVPDPTRPLVRMRGSSTIRDTHGDVMALSALQDMTEVPVGLAIWHNHDYSLPESYFGRLAEAPTITTQDGIADLWLTVEVELSSDKAAKTYALIQKGSRFGCSIGFTVLDYDIDDAGVVHLLHVQPVEWSVVGVPANQRCWVETGLKGVFARTYDPRLAPAVRACYPGDYDDLISRLDSEAQAHYRSIAPRSQAATRLYSLPDGRFRLKSDQRSEVLSRAEVVTLLETLPQAPEAPAVVTKAVTGKADWPLADLERSWEGSVAEERLRHWAGLDGTGSLDPTKYAAVHFWQDATDPTKLSSYKLPFCDVIDGAVQAVPKAIFAAAAAIQGARGGLDVPESDLAGIKDKIAAYYTRIGTTYDRPDLTAPWEKAAEVVTPESPVSPPDGEEDPDDMTKAQALLWQQRKQLDAALGLPGEAPATLADQATRLASIKEAIATLTKELGELQTALTPETPPTTEGLLNLIHLLIDSLHAEKAGKRFSQQSMDAIKAAHHALCSVTQGKVCKMAISDGMVPGYGKKDDGDAATDDDGDAATDDDGDAATDDDGDAATDDDGDAATDDDGDAATDDDGDAATDDDGDAATDGMRGGKRGGKATPKKAARPRTDPIAAALARLEADLTAAKAEAAAARQDAAAARKQADDLANQPLGRPTLAPDVPPPSTIGEALARTTVKQVGDQRVRVWAKGITPRPDLTSSQMILMNVNAIYAYQHGEACEVPELA